MKGDPTLIVSGKNSISTRNGRCGFTLVELLVVVGIIVLLLGIALPVITRAREQGNQAKCLSNIRQLLTAFIAYTNNNGGRFPRPGSTRPAQPNGDEQPEDWIYWQPDRVFENGKVIPQYAPKEILYCPSDDPEHHSRRLPNLYAYSYSVNVNVCTLYPGKTLLWSDIVNASNTILVIDECASTVDDGAWAWQSNNGITPGTPPAKYNLGYNLLSIRHTKLIENEGVVDAGKGNAGFCDGHAALIERKDSFNARYYDPNYR